MNSFNIKNIYILWLHQLFLHLVISSEGMEIIIFWVSGWRFEESEPKMSELERTLEGIYPTTLILQIGLRQRNKSA